MCQKETLIKNSISMPWNEVSENLPIFIFHAPRGNSSIGYLLSLRFLNAAFRKKKKKKEKSGLGPDVQPHTSSPTPSFLGKKTLLSSSSSSRRGMTVKKKCVPASTMQPLLLQHQQQKREEEKKLYDKN